MPELRNVWLWSRVEEACRRTVMNGDVTLTVRMKDGVAVHAYVERGRESIRGERPVAQRKDLL